MNEQRWYVVLVVAVLMVFTLGLMNKYGRTLVPRLFGPAIAPMAVSEDLPDRAPVLDEEGGTSAPEVISSRKLSPPPDGMFDSPSSAQVNQGFQAINETARAISAASEIVEGGASSSLRLDSPAGGTR